MIEHESTYQSCLGSDLNPHSPDEIAILSALVAVLG
jgi:hypothetical protein